jgi:site-specific recombinase XerD
MSRRDLSPREAVERWLGTLRRDLADATVRDYGYRLRQFVQWSEDQGIDSMRELDGWTLDEYQNHRRKRIAAVTLSNELTTLRQFLRYCERIEIAPEDIHEKIEPPGVEESDEVSETKLPADDAQQLLAAFRDGPDRATRHHVTLELLWYTSARMGALRALDVDDFDREARTVMFRHVEKQGTPLKNAQSGERVVGLPDTPADIVAEWIDENRPQSADEWGREPLLATTFGRVSKGTLREWCYFATIPCRFRECPHGEAPATCDWNAQNQATHCPSSVSPHPVRSGSMEWQRDQRVPIEVVSDRANASPEVIEKHYDNPDPHRAQQQRRRPYLGQLEFDGASDSDDEDSDS